MSESRQGPHIANYKYIMNVALQQRQFLLRAGKLHRSVKGVLKVLVHEPSQLISSTSRVHSNSENPHYNLRILYQDDSTREWYHFA